MGYSLMITMDMFMTLFLDQAREVYMMGGTAQHGE